MHSNWKINNASTPSMTVRKKSGVPLLIFFTCLICYLFFLSGHHYSIDGVVMFQYAKTLLFDHSFTMAPPLIWGREFVTSKWPIGLTLVYIPILSILSITVFKNNPEISEIPYDPSQSHYPALLNNRPYEYSSFLNPFITALTAVTLYQVCRSMGFSQKKASLVVLVFGLISPSTVYTKYDYAQSLATFFIIVSIYFLIRGFTYDKKNIFFSGACLGFGVLTRPELIIMPGFFMTGLVYFIAPSIARLPKPSLERLSNVFWFSVPLIGAIILNQYINYSRFGYWFSTGYQQGSDYFNLNFTHFTNAVLGNLVSPGRGLFVFYPLSLLSMIGIVHLYKRDLRIAILFTSITLGFLVFYSTWNDWGAGISWGPRFLIPAIPGFTVLAFLGFDSLSKTIHLKALPFVILVALLTVGAIVTVQGLVFNFLEFYSKFELSGPMIVGGLYHFRPEYSPIINGWGNLFSPSHFDILLFQRRSEPVYNLLIMLLSFAGGIITMLWITFFHRAEE